MKQSLLRDLPLLELMALEATIRLGSVTRAAEELSVTPSAVSHRIRQIERALGVDLIVRKGRGVAPTPAGEACHADMMPLLERFREASRALKAQAMQSVHVDAAPLIGSTWIAPQLSRLRSALGVPTLRFELSTNRIPGASQNPDTDLVVDFTTVAPDSDARLLCAGCVRVYVRAADGGKGQLTLDALQSQPLIRHTSADWQQWIGAVFGKSANLRYSATFDDPVSAVEACLAGQGPVLLGTLAAQAYVEAGMLRPGHPGSLNSGIYTIRLTPRGTLNPLARRTLDHLVEWGRQMGTQSA